MFRLENESFLLQLMRLFLLGTIFGLLTLVVCLTVFGITLTDLRSGKGDRKGGPASTTFDSGLLLLCEKVSSGRWYRMVPGPIVFVITHCGSLPSRAELMPLGILWLRKTVERRRYCHEGGCVRVGGGGRQKN